MYTTIHAFDIPPRLATRLSSMHLRDRDHCIHSPYADRSRHCNAPGRSCSSGLGLAGRRSQGRCSDTCVLMWLIVPQAARRQRDMGGPCPRSMPWRPSTEAACWWYRSWSCPRPWRWWRSCRRARASSANSRQRCNHYLSFRSSVIAAYL